MPSPSIALIGDYDSDVTAHRAIPLAIQLASRELRERPLVTWLPTESLASASDETLAQYAGFWCVPGSPYQRMDGALHAIRFARERKVPFLGTCAGFQHALIEYARSVLKLSGADHQESNPIAQLPLIAPLACTLVEVEDRIFLREGSLVAQIYGRTAIDEPYHWHKSAVTNSSVARLQVSYNARMEMQNARNHQDGTCSGRASLERVKTIRIWHEICPEHP
jgi:CTP synthase (UTP-ammonia lyase)